jgi:hypothetical protein
METMLFDNLGTRGISVSKVVQLSQPSQICCMVAATCGPSPGTFLETVLEYPGGMRETVSRTMASPNVANSLRNGASLFLPAGTYVWTAILASSLGAPVIPSDIQTLDPQILGEPSHSGYVGAVGVAGSSDGFFLIRPATECQIKATLNISGPLAGGERISSAMVITDRDSNSQVESLPSEIVGPNNRQLIIEANPYFLKARHTYKFFYTLSPMPASAGLCSLSVQG